MSGRPDHDPTRHSYDALAERYSAQFGDELAYNPLDRALLRALVEQLPEGATVADLGCGPGHVAVAFYSIIHLGERELAPACAELRRVLVSGGRLLVAFHVGDEVRHVDELWGLSVNLDFRLLETRAVVEMLDHAGFEIEAQLERTSYPTEVETRRAYLVAHRR